MTNQPTYEELLTKIKALEESEKKYRELVESALVGIYRRRITDGKILIANKALAKILGYGTVGELKEGCDPSFHYKDYDADTEGRKKLFRQLRSDGRLENLKIEMKRKDGSVFHAALSMTMYPERDYVEGFLVDISEWKKSEHELVESEERFRVLFEQAADTIFLHDKEGKIHLANSAACEKLGYTKDELMKMTIPDFALEYDPSRRDKMWGSLPLTFETYYRRKDGATFPIENRLSRIRFRDQDLILAIVRDISDRKKAEKEKEKFEAQMIHAQRMESLGTLAGGISHDFNNLLMGIQGRASLMACDLEPDHPHFEHAKAILEYTHSAADLTRQLLGLARGGKYDVKPVDLNDIVSASAAMFGRTKKEIRIHQNLCSETPVVLADKTQIEQVLLNLYVNAWQAMPRSGEIFLETSIEALNEAYCKPYAVEPGRYAKVSVTDTGIGMDKSVLAQVFDPFFTTKEKSRGTGLGLASAYGIVKNHSGIINVYSEVGHGTTFNIYFPLSGKKALKDEPASAEMLKGSENILLVDDEELILDVGKAMLQHLGYHVLVASSGEQAVGMLNTGVRMIDLVVLDLIMPGMDGAQTFDLIRKEHPRLPVLLSSGYSMDGKAAEIMGRGCNGFIQKPFNVHELSEKVRVVIEEAKGNDQGE